MSERIHAIAATGRARVVAAVALCGLLSGCGGALETPDPAPRLDVTPAPIATATGLNGGPVAPPREGAYLGAWVKPRVVNQRERIAAFDRFEARLGRQVTLVNTYRPFTEEFFTQSDLHFLQRGSILMLSWASGDTRATALGRYDELIRERAERVAELDRPIMIRFRWEMDRPNLRASMWSGADYIAAWKHVRRLFREEGATNVSWVWCPTAEGFAGGSAPEFYPGDDEVDWLCVDVYAASRFADLNTLLTPFLQWSAARPKPIIIGEYGVSRAYPAARRAEWLTNAASVFRANPQIKAVSYFESDPDPKDEAQQFAISDTPAALRSFTSMARDAYFAPRAP
ncbi:endoglucanase [Luedemannella helvata]|uniref:GH26 domain-containing protein n=1 Tax=Luedemannella helvata TaxID=349315 RepID=A0ABN2JQ03_9ACTN